MIFISVCVFGGVVLQERTLGGNDLSGHGDAIPNPLPRSLAAVDEFGRDGAIVVVPVELFTNELNPCPCGQDLS